MLKRGRKKGAAPTSGATNAYQLLGDVCAAVEEEPKRLWMSNWLLRGKDEIESAISGSFNDRPVPTEAPSCGTMGCVAGWVVALHSPHSRLDPEEKAEDIVLGKRDFYADPDFGTEEYDRYTDLRNLFLDDFPEDRGIKPGTKAYVRHVVKRIKAFMRKHKVALVARKFPTKRKAA